MKRLSFILSRKSLLIIKKSFARSYLDYAIIIITNLLMNLSKEKLK